MRACVCRRDVSFDRSPRERGSVKGKVVNGLSRVSYVCTTRYVKLQSGLGLGFSGAIEKSAKMHEIFKIHFVDN